MKNLILYTLQKFPICLFSPPFKEGLGVVKGAKRYLALICFCLLLIACKPDREILPKNPCEGAQPLKANFTIKEVLNDCEGKTFLHETDTIYGYNPVEFEVTEPNVDSVRWTLGAETLKIKKFRRMYFPDYVPLPVKLIVFRKPNSCYPNDKSTDTLTKYFYSSSNFYYIALPFMGLYLGYNTDAPMDTFRVWFCDTLKDYKVKAGFTHRYTNTVTGLPRGHHARRRDEWFMCSQGKIGGKVIDLTNQYSKENGKKFYFNEVFVFGLGGKAVYDKGTITFNYYYSQECYETYKTGKPFTGTKEWTHKVFIGKKLWPK